MRDSSEKKRIRDFAESAMRRRPDKVSIEKIVYLDEDLQTYKYFMTGDFDEKARRDDKLAQQAESHRIHIPKKSSDDEQDDDQENEKEGSQRSNFLNKLQSLTDKINLFKT